MRDEQIVPLRARQREDARARGPLLAVFVAERALDVDGVGPQFAQFDHRERPFVLCGADRRDVIAIPSAARTGTVVKTITPSGA